MRLKGRSFWKANFMILGFIALGVLLCKQKVEGEKMNPPGFHIKRGVNLSHWLSQDFGWAPKYTYINESDIQFIRSIGYDHVRIPIDEKEMWDESGKPIDAAFQCLHNCLSWCAKYDLRAIVDLHIIRAHHFNAANEGGVNTLWTDATAQDNFVNLWVRLSGVLHSYPNDKVAYEILNEAVAPEHEDWNKLMNKAVAAIRALEPERMLIIGPNMWQIPQNLQYLRLPEGDRHIILSFHTYSPLAFTHHLASWTAVKYYTGPVHYPGQVITDQDYAKYVDPTNKELVNQIADARELFNKQRLVDMLKSGIEFARAKNLQLYCGEFGCLPTVPRKDRLQYYADMISAFEENNIAWCNWEYKGDFGIYFFDAEKKVSLQPDNEFINVLLKNAKVQ
jgi:endoglucanase